MEYKYKTQGVCSSEIKFEINGNIISNVSFVGGCNGNLKAISKLVEGMRVEEIEEKLSGNTCGWRNTSCADQFAKAVRKAYEESRKNC
ncbi:MAG: TIGR03905 family TSCPD domain-containing protein [Clostridia bacterium]|nr:TIGR03905 family TSCPD domain-containing protein [Clostridia bacterium]